MVHHQHHHHHLSVTSTSLPLYFFVYVFTFSRPSTFMFFSAYAGFLSTIHRVFDARSPLLSPSFSVTHDLDLTLLFFG